MLPGHTDPVGSERGFGSQRVGVRLGTMNGRQAMRWVDEGTMLAFELTPNQVDGPGD